MVLKYPDAPLFLLENSRHQIQESLQRISISLIKILMSEKKENACIHTCVPPRFLGITLVPYGENEGNGTFP